MLSAQRNEPEIPYLRAGVVNTIREPERSVPVTCEADVCVIGGSCTGVFAAVRAARLGMRVALVEKGCLLGGMATLGLVADWHSTRDTGGEEKIIGGLLDEVLERLRRADALVEIPPGRRVQYRFNPAVLACELDVLVQENGVETFLDSTCSAPVLDGSRIEAVVVEDRSGRRAIRAPVFVDASGDGVLLRRAGFGAVQEPVLQPVSYQMLATGIDSVQRRHPGVNVWREVRDLASEYGVPESNPWIHPVPGVPGVQNLFGARLNGVDASDPEQFTRACLEGRRCARAFLEMIRRRFPEVADEVGMVAAAPTLGVRETWHACCRHRLTSEELLSGREYDDAIANGTYPVDVHGPEGTVLRYLDGRESFTVPGGERSWRRWRSADQPTPRCYHIPLRSLIPSEAANLLVAGRLVDADRDAYGAVRVMVNCNQTGEAAGVTAALAADADGNVSAVPVERVRTELAAGGSIVLPV